MKAIGDCQARAIAHDYILFEIAKDVAATNSEPQRYLADVYERVMSRWERSGPLESESHPVSAEVRWTFENFFGLASKGLP